ncbi:hypothetical protein ABIB62_001075 [Mucilaginibacter sp. UYP25]|uniref:hypothetical protein n=1 Tax=unclassified Mucilaginibacter TaxID=2617802 RepID=UPI003392D35F
MKKIIITACFIVTYIAITFAQDKPVVSVDALISAKHFAFVVTKMQTRPIYVTAYDSYPTPAITPSQMNLSLFAQTQIAGGKASNFDQNRYVSEINVDHNYYNAYGIDKYPHNQDRYNTQKGEAVFMIQLPDGLLLSGDQTPTDIGDITDKDFYAYQSKDVINNVRADKGNFKLTYSVGKGKDKRKFDMEIANNGAAMIKLAPSGNNRQYLYGYIVDSQSLQFNKEQ